VVQISSWEEMVKLDIECFILYTWLSPTYNTLVRLLKENGKKVIVKADSDGRIGTSVEPKPHFWKLRFLFTPPLWKVPFRFFLATQKWRDLRKIEQISMVDSVVLESPDAASNVAFFLSNLGYRKLVGKVCVIPNPVTPDITRSAMVPRKENIVVSVGRWDDWLQKNPRLLADVLTRFMLEVNGWRAVIIGDGEKYLREVLKDFVRDGRVEVVGSVPHEQIKQYFGRAKIFLASSRFESFNIAAAEAMCLGCSLVGTPLEPFRYFVKGGEFGSIATSFSVFALLGALIHEVFQWLCGKRDPLQSAEFFRARLDRKAVAKGYLDVFSKG
jgi:glycosyltransferase involved in cell wall biosynthesis